MEILAEARGLRSVGVSLPSPVLSLLNQEKKIKTFYHLLDQSVTELYATLDKIDKKLKPLFHSLVELVLRYACAINLRTLTFSHTHLF